MPLVIALSGFKNGGKTTLALGLLREILSAGLSAAFVKHTEKDVLPPEETDTGKTSAMGIPSLYWGGDGALLEARAGEISREKILEFFPGKDIVIVEGAKGLPLPRIWVGDPCGVPPDVKGVFAFFDRTASGSDGKKVFFPGREKDLAVMIIGMYERTGGIPRPHCTCRERRFP